MPSAAIEVRGLVKTYGDVHAVAGVDLVVPAGHCVSLLGPNGAGKTTAMRILCTTLRPTGGAARVAGFDVLKEAQEVRRRIGFLSATTGLYDRLTAWELVEFFGRLHEPEPDRLRRARGSRPPASIPP